MKCTCGHPEMYNYAIDNGRCNMCIMKELDQLQTDLDKANKAILEYEQTEASVCPEDVGVVRYVTALQTQLATAKEENRKLREKFGPCSCGNTINHNYCTRCLKQWES